MFHEGDFFILFFLVFVISFTTRGTSFICLRNATFFVSFKQLMVAVLTTKKKQYLEVSHRAFIKYIFWYFSSSKLV